MTLQEVLLSARRRPSLIFRPVNRRGYGQGFSLDNEDPDIIVHCPILSRKTPWATLTVSDILSEWEVVSRTKLEVEGHALSQHDFTFLDSAEQ